MNLSKAIAQIEAAMANAVRQREYYRRMLDEPGKCPARCYDAHYLALMQRMRQKWAGKVYGLEAARKIVGQVDEIA